MHNERILQATLLPTTTRAGIALRFLCDILRPHQFDRIKTLQKLGGSTYIDRNKKHTSDIISPN